MYADKLILQTSNWQDFTNKLKDVSKKRGMRHMGNVYERIVWNDWVINPVSRIINTQSRPSKN